MPKFCSNCGTPAATDDVKFCEQCGTAFPVLAASTRTPAGTPLTSAPAPTQSSNLFKIVAIVLGLIMLMTVVAIASFIYLGIRVKRKAEQIATEVKKEAAKERAEARDEPNNVEKSSAQSCPAVDPDQSQAFRTAAASASIPLKPGLALVSVYTRVDLNGRDVEILKTIQSIDENSVTVQAGRTEPGNSASTRVLCLADLMGARQTETYFHPQMPRIVGGTTMFSVSQAIFQDLKAARPAGIGYVEVDPNKSRPDRIEMLEDSEGILARVEPNDVPYSVIVNGERKELPAIHVKGQLGGRDTEAYVLDDPANPITLNWTVPTRNFHITYLKINFPVEKKIEQDIAKNRCAAVYGIYFDFDSAKLRPESGPALKEIADAVRDNPAWNLKIEGHTDSVGGDAYNMTLSSQRAESVRQALVNQFAISVDRLTSAGFGATRPKAPNDTVEGRALNRRVELCRQ